MFLLQLLLVQLFVFGLLVLVLRSILKRHVGSASSHLDELTQDCAQKLTEAKKRMDEANAHYNQTLTQSREDAERLKQQLIKEGMDAKEEMLEQARQQSLEIMRKAQTASDILIQELERKIDEKAIQKAHALVEELLPGTMSVETHSSWVKELLRNGFEGLDRLNISDKLEEAVIVTAFPLKDQERTALQESLKKKMGRAIHLKEEINPDLILGMRVTVGSLVLDGSFQFKIEELLRKAQNANN